MDQALEKNPFDTIDFTIAAKHYINLLRSHIEKENDILYPFGDNFLSEEEQRALLERFEAHEEQVIGRGKHEELHAQLEEWSAKYLHGHQR
jgi:hemerythrin-like domain-containing protein